MWYFPHIEGDLLRQVRVDIQKHSFDSGDSDCETVLDQLYQAYAESHESDPMEIGDGFKELEEILSFLHCSIKTPSFPLLYQKWGIIGNF